MVSPDLHRVCQPEEKTCSLTLLQNDLACFCSFLECTVLLFRIVHALRICAKGTSHNFPADFSRQMNVMSGKFTVFIVATHHPEIKYFSLFSHQLGV